MMQYVYLIRLREFINTNEPLYKIGRTTQEPGKRMASYPKDSEVILFVKVNDCQVIENLIKERFTKKFNHETDKGSEYFSGDVYLMMDEIITIVKYHNDDKPEVPDIKPVKVSKPKVVRKPSAKKSTSKTGKKEVIELPKPVLSGKTYMDIATIQCDKSDIATQMRLIPHIASEMEKKIEYWRGIFTRFFGWQMSENIFAESDEYYMQVLYEGNEIFRIHIPKALGSTHHKFTNINLHKFEDLEKLNKYSSVNANKIRGQLCQCSLKNIVGEIYYKDGGLEKLFIVECEYKRYLIGQGYPMINKEFWENLYNTVIKCTNCNVKWLN